MHIPDAPSGTLINADQYNAIVEVIRQIVNFMPGPGLAGGFSHNGLDVSIDAWLLKKIEESAEATDPDVVDPTLPFTARLHTPVAGSTNQWSYPFTKVIHSLSMDGYGPGLVAWSDDTLTGTAYNLAEFETATTRLGNGVDPANIPEGWAVMPCPAGALVTITPHKMSGDEFAYTFRHDNAVDGVCE